MEEETEFDIVDLDEIQHQEFRPHHVYTKLLESPTATCDQPKGLRSGVTLFPYQRRSLATMYQKETNPASYPHPLSEPILRGDGRPDIAPSSSPNDSEEQRVFKNVVTGAYSNQIPMLKEDRGGILCEDMGTGKTIICISLILKTIGTPATSPPWFPLRRNNKLEDEGALLSLKELCAIKMKYAIDPHNTSALIPEELKDLIKSATFPFIKYFQVNTSARIPETKCMKIVISSSTLVVVPNSIVEQWLHEIYKFVEDGALRILVCMKRSQIPPPTELANYDVVLVSHKLVSDQSFSGEIGRPNGNACGCDNMLGNFCEECEVRSDISPLLQVYWLRLIVDEGHVMGNATSNLSFLLNNLLVERKWCCSGTPTPDSTVASELNHLYGLVRFCNSNVEQNPFADKKLWNKFISRPIRNHDRAGLRTLLALLQRLMIRNKNQDIQREVNKRGCIEKVIMLDFEPREAIRYNQALGHMKINLIASRYEGSDSLWDPSNRKYAMQAISKLKAACYQAPALDEGERQLALKEIEDELNGNNGKIPLTEDEIAMLKSIKPFMEVDVTNFPDEGSTKESYLLNRIRELPDGCKCIVFSQFNDTLRRLLDTFDKVGIPCAEVHMQASPRKRASEIVTFQTNPNVRVIVMKTELAAYGINLIAANYVVFLDPVLDKHKEAQAIGRANRIGQIREVTVEKLVVRGTMDELVLHMKEETVKPRDQDQSTIRTLLGDAKLVPLNIDTLHQYETISKPKESTTEDEELMEDFRSEHEAHEEPSLQSIPMLEEDLRLPESDTLSTPMIDTWESTILQDQERMPKHKRVRFDLVETSDETTKKWKSNQTEGFDLHSHEILASLE